MKKTTAPQSIRFERAKIKPGAREHIEHHYAGRTFVPETLEVQHPEWFEPIDFVIGGQSQVENRELGFKETFDEIRRGYSVRLEFRNITNLPRDFAAILKEKEPLASRHARPGDRDRRLAESDGRPAILGEDDPDFGRPDVQTGDQAGHGLPAGADRGPDPDDAPRGLGLRDQPDSGQGLSTQSAALDAFVPDDVDLDFSTIEIG